MTTDRGLQVERTVVAWTRTASAAAASGLLLVPRLLHDGADAVALAMLAAGFGLALLTLVEARRRRRRLTGSAPVRAVPAANLVRLAAGIALLGVLLVVSIA